MDFDFTEEQRLLDETVRRLVKDEYGFEKRKGYTASPEGFSRKLWQSYAEIGLLGLPFAESDGGFGVLSGEKGVVLHGDGADQLIVSARTGGSSRDKKGISLFLVDRKAKGIRVRGYPTVDGLRAAELALDQVRVGADALL